MIQLNFRNIRKLTKKTELLNVNFVCRMPEEEGWRMICCNICKEWFHEGCVEIPTEAWMDKDFTWTCSYCWFIKYLFLTSLKRLNFVLKNVGVVPRHVSFTISTSPSPSQRGSPFHKGVPKITVILGTWDPHNIGKIGTWVPIFPVKWEPRVPILTWHQFEDHT